MTPHTTGWGLVTIGALLVAIGAVGFMLDGDDDRSPSAATVDSVTPSAPTSTSTTAVTTIVATTTTSPPPTTTTAVATTTTSPPPTTTTTVPAGTPEEFIATFAMTLRTRDVEFLFARLHPLVFKRYDEAACHAYLASRDSPGYAAEVVSVGAVAPWLWELDGLVREIAGTTTVRVRFAEDGVTFSEADVHVVVDDAGTIRWFTDCGTPREGAR